MYSNSLWDKTQFTNKHKYHYIFFYFLTVKVHCKCIVNKSWSFDLQIYIHTINAKLNGLKNRFLKVSMKCLNHTLSEAQSYFILMFLNKRKNNIYRMTYVCWRVIILSVRLQIIGIFSQITCAPLISNHWPMDVGRKRSGSHVFRAVCARVASVALWYVNCTWSTRKSTGIPLDEPFFTQRDIFVIVWVGLCDHYLESREKFAKWFSMIF